MPKSRRDKSRKENLSEYKEKVKEKQTMANLPEQRPFQQVPTWDSNSTFEIKGFELEALYNFFNIFSPAFTSIQQIFARGVQAGTIKIGYQYEDGTPVSSEEVADYTKKIQEYFAQRQAEEDEKAEKPKSKIVSFTGEPVMEG
jgi:hypothetical protein